MNNMSEEETGIFIDTNIKNVLHITGLSEWNSNWNSYMEDIKLLKTNNTIKLSGIKIIINNNKFGTKNNANNLLETIIETLTSKKMLSRAQIIFSSNDIKLEDLENFNIKNIRTNKNKNMIIEGYGTTRPLISDNNMMNEEDTKTRLGITESLKQFAEENDIKFIEKLYRPSTLRF